MEIKFYKVNDKIEIILGGKLIPIDDALLEITKDEKEFITILRDDGVALITSQSYKRQCEFEEIALIDIYFNDNYKKQLELSLSKNNLDQLPSEAVAELQAIIEL